MQVLATLLALAAATAGDVSVTRPIARGEVLTPGDLTGQAEEKAGLVGMALRRSLAEGARVRPVDVQPPLAVMRQDTVVVRFRRGALSLQTEGRALAGGTVGQRIGVLLPGRRRPLTAVVTGAGEVEVGS